MKTHTTYPQKVDSLMSFINYLNDEVKCRQYFESLRWGNGPTCPYCHSENFYRFSDGVKIKCADCRKIYTAKVGTVLANSKIPLNKWLVAYYLITEHKSGISSHQLARDIEITQKSSWFLLHRIRHGLFFNEPDGQLEGRVEFDETFVGGKNKNRHWDKKVKNSQGRSFKDKTPVFGMLQEGEYKIVERPHKIIPSKVVKEKIVIKSPVVRCKVVANTQGDTLQPIIVNNVKENSVVISDEWTAYQGLNSRYDHRVVDHGRGQYVNEIGDTSNRVEGVWNGFKRSYIGIYRRMDRHHLQRYASEIAFRFNTCAMKNSERFNLALSRSKGTLKYKDLISRKNKISVT